MKTRRFFYFGKFAVMGVAGMILFTFVVMWIWNWLVPELFHGPIISYWQTLGLLLLSKILFSGVGKGGSSHSRRYSHHSKHCHHPEHDHSSWCDDEYSHNYKSKWRQKYEEKMKAKQEGEGDSKEVTATE